MRELVFVAAALAISGCGAGSTQATCTTNADCGTGFICGGGSCFPSGGGGGGGGGDSDEDGADSGADDAAGADAGDSGADGGDAAGDSGDGDGGDPELIPDETGPVISIESPEPYEIVGSRLFVTVEITDEQSGVDEETIVITIADSPDVTYLIEPIYLGGTLTAVVDATQFAGFAFPRITVAAKDNDGNATNVGMSFAIDNTSPIVAFTSADFQIKGRAGTGYKCSQHFDPLGSGKLGHADVFPMPLGDSDTTLTTYPRLRIEDFANPDGYYAGIDNATTQLFILSKTGINAGVKLVVGGNGSVCKDIGANAVPRDPIASTQAIVQTLVPTNVGGAPTYTSPLVSPSDSCDVPGTDVDSADDECRLGVRGPIGITYWTHYGSSHEPNVYVLNEFVSKDPLNCGGGPFDMRNLDVDGPVCIAARVVDNVGNVGVSDVVAICVDRDGTGNECASFNADTVRASCMDGCNPRAFAIPPGGINVEDE